MSYALGFVHKVEIVVNQNIVAWLEMKYRGYWLTSADRFLVEIAAGLMARYRIDELKSGDMSMLITLLGKIGFSPNDRGKMNLPTNSA
jgi:hypothetical protein